MTALELWSEQYQSGDASAEDVVGQAKTAAKIMRGTGPTDYSLRQSRRLVIGMLSEYAKGVQLHERKRDAGPTMYRAYGLANFAHTVLLQAERPLDHLGCDVRPAALTGRPLTPARADRHDGGDKGARCIVLSYCG